MKDILRIASVNKRTLSIICFSLFFGWLLAVPFEGQVLQMLLKQAGMEGSTQNTIALVSHFCGLLISAFLVKNQDVAKKIMVMSVIVCIMGNISLLFPVYVLWNASILIMSFCAGFFVTSWAFYYKALSKPKERLKTAADVLIYSNIFMIFLNVLSKSTSATVGIAISIIVLLFVLIITQKLYFKNSNIVFGSHDFYENGINARNNMRSDHIMDAKSKSKSKSKYNYKPLVFLCIFVLIITINSGLMYQVVNPAFSQYEFLLEYYWAVPYIAALIIMRNMPLKINKAYILYTAMIMIGLAFILFTLLETTVLSYFITNTLMLGAFGVCDLFWWSIAGAFFEFYKNPSKILGMILSVNVLGVFLGGVLGNIIALTANPRINVLLISMSVIFIVMIMLPALNNQILKLIKNHEFIMKFSNLGDLKADESVWDGRDISRLKAISLEEKRNLAYDLVSKTQERERAYNYKNNEPKQAQFNYETDFSNVELTENDTIEDILTPREKEVVQLLLSGYTYKAMSDYMSISENTVKYHIKNLYSKLNVNNKMDLIKIFSKNLTQ